MDIIGDVAGVNDVAQSSLSMGGVIGLVIGGWVGDRYFSGNRVRIM